MTPTTNPARGRVRFPRGERQRGARRAWLTGQRDQRHGPHELIAADRPVGSVTAATAGGHVLLGHLMRQMIHPAGDRDRDQPISHEHHHSPVASHPGRPVTRPGEIPARPTARSGPVARRACCPPSRPPHASYERGASIRCGSMPSLGGFCAGWVVSWASVTIPCVEVAYEVGPHADQLVVVVEADA
jgi:hypothetical protein